MDFCWNSGSSLFLIQSAVNSLLPYLCTTDFHIDYILHICFHFVVFSSSYIIAEGQSVWSLLLLNYKASCFVANMYHIFASRSNLNNMSFIYRRNNLQSSCVSKYMCISLHVRIRYTISLFKLNMIWIISSTFHMVFFWQTLCK